MRARLARIGDAMDERKVAGRAARKRIIDRRQELEGRVQRGKTIAEANRVFVVIGVKIRTRRIGSTFREIRGSASQIVGGRVGRNSEGGPAGVVGGIQNGNEGVKAVIGAAQPDEEDFLLFSIRPLDSN